MEADQVALIQNKIVGVALRATRLQAGKDIESCAEVLSWTSEDMALAEEGTLGLALPQIEALAHFLNVPASQLLGESDLSIQEAEAPPPAYDNMMLVRRKIVGVILRQARLTFGRSLDEVSAEIGYTPEHLARIELGEAQVSLGDLHKLADCLGIPFESFLEQDVIPMTQAERNAQMMRNLERLAPELREFILKPINTPYLQVAMNLSRMPAEALRQIASGLLEITY